LISKSYNTWGRGRVVYSRKLCSLNGMLCFVYSPLIHICTAKARMSLLHHFDFNLVLNSLLLSWFLHYIYTRSYSLFLYFLCPEYLVKWGSCCPMRRGLLNQLHSCHFCLRDWVMAPGYRSRECHSLAASEHLL